jgi:hypothetical protein
LDRSGRHAHVLLNEKSSRAGLLVGPVGGI